MKKVIVVLCSIVILVIVGVAGIFASMTIKTNSAVKKQVNYPVAMEKVADGTYLGQSDGGMVQVEVAVTVKNHRIEGIELIRHENGKGAAAEAIISEMVAKNTYEVDVVSSATISSKTIMNAVNNALTSGQQKNE